MENAIQILAENYDLPLSHPRIQEAYYFIENNKNHPSLSYMIQSHYRPTSLKVNTAGAYLWGSLQNYYGDVNKSCSGLANNSLFNSEEGSCQYQIWTYTETLRESGKLHKELNSQGHSSSSKAYIYVDSDWIGFENKDIEKLKNANIEYATILKTKDNKHEIILPMTAIGNIPVLEEGQYLGEVIEHVTEKKSNFSYYLLVFLIFIVLLFIIFRYKNRFVNLK